MLAEVPEAVYLAAAQAMIPGRFAASRSREPGFRAAVTVGWAAALSHVQAAASEAELAKWKRLASDTTMAYDVLKAENAELRRIGTPEWEEEQATAQAEANGQRSSDEEWYDHG